MQELVWPGPQTAKAVGLSLRTVRRLEAAGDFPPHIVLSGRRIGWKVESVKKWVENRAAECEAA